MIQGLTSSPLDVDEREPTDPHRLAHETRAPLEPRSIAGLSIPRPSEDPALLRLARAQ